MAVPPAGPGIGRGFSIGLLAGKIRDGYIGEMVEWTRLGAKFAAPSLWSYEVGSALRKAVVTGFIATEGVDAMVAQVWALDIESIPDSPALQRRVLAWAERLGQSKSYNGAYLAVAEVLGAEFWTADRRLVQGADVGWVRWLESGLDDSG